MKKLICLTTSLLIALVPTFASAVYFQDYDDDGDVEMFYLKDLSILDNFTGEIYEYEQDDYTVAILHLDPARGIGRNMADWYVDPVVFPAVTIDDFIDQGMYVKNSVAVDCPYLPNGTQFVLSAEYELDDFLEYDTFHLKGVSVEIGYPNPGPTTNIDTVTTIDGTTYKILGGSTAFSAFYLNYDTVNLHFAPLEKPMFLNTSSRTMFAEFYPLSGTGKTSLPQFEVSLYRMDDWLCVHMNSFDENGELIPYYEIDPNGLNSYTIDIPYLDYDYLYDQVAAQTKDLPDNSAFWDHHAGDFASTFWNLTKQLFGITWPGTKVSILGIYLSCVATVFVISLVHRFVGFSFTISPHTSARSLAESYRSSSKSDYNISKEREGDEI